MLGKLIIAGTVGAVIGAAVVAAAAPEFNLKGGRFKPLTYAELTPEQKAYADKELAAGRNPTGGPFNIYLRSPEYAELSAPLSNYLRFKSPMPRKLKEIANMLTGRYWGGQSDEGAAYLRLHARAGIGPDNLEYRALFLSAGVELRLDPERWRDRG